VAVRWSSEDGLDGYGVYGNFIENDNTVIVDQVLARIISEITFPEQDGSSPPNPYLQYCLSVSWRFSIQLIDSNPTLIDQFFNPLGVKRLGRFSVERAGYTTSDGFWSYDNFLSPKYIATCIILRNLDPGEGESEFEELPPSSEPQDEIPEISPPYLIAFSQSDTLGGGKNNFATSIGDTFFLSVETGVISYRLGVTYDFNIQPFIDDFLSGTSGLAAYLI